MEEEKQETQHSLWSYKYVGTVESTHMEYIFMDIEAAPPTKEALSKISELREKFSNLKYLRIYYSDEKRTFILEPSEG